MLVDQSQSVADLMRDDVAISPIRDVHGLAAADHSYVGTVSARVLHADVIAVAGAFSETNGCHRAPRGRGISPSSAVRGRDCGIELVVKDTAWPAITGEGVVDANRLRRVAHVVDLEKGASGLCVRRQRAEIEFRPRPIFC